MAKKLKQNSKTKEINILFLFHDTELNNGAVRSMVDVIEAMIMRYPVKAVVVYSDNKGTAIDYLESKGVNCYKIRYGHWAYNSGETLFYKFSYIIKMIIKLLLSVVNLYKFKKIIVRESISVLYSNTSVIYIGVLLHEIFGIPHVWHIREFGREDHGLKFIFGRKYLYKKMSESTDLTIYISNSVKEKYEKNMKNNVKSCVIYNDISPYFINPKDEINKNNYKLVLGVIGELKEGKAQLDVIKAVEQLYSNGVNLELHIAGNKEGNYYNYINQYVINHNLERIVIFDGFIRDVNSYRKKIDVGIVPSVMEAFGRVTIEGMLSMMAMIGTTSAGTSELIENNKTGLLYETHNIEQLAEKILLLYNDRDLLEKIAVNGYKYAKDNFTVSRAAYLIYINVKKMAQKTKLDK